MSDPRKLEVGRQKRHAILAFVRDYTKQHGYPPKYAEIGVEVGVSKPMIHKYLTGLKADGKVDFVPGEPRTLVVRSG